ncbi:hypothetical protein AVEN_238-1 [Araneus ventricosus]|uniref:Uncharacterized protein n=1 Tax=Araneus ventricosus TaxID=182803 RepID=A0A4Y2VDU8_ARAVE|nr:hypothetical protein AVEN_238-1 [Araneus ventricosus]
MFPYVGKDCQCHRRPGVLRDKKESSNNDLAEKEPNSEEAFHCLEKAMKWLKREEECDAIQLLSLKRVRDLAFKKNEAHL